MNNKDPNADAVKSGLPLPLRVFVGVAASLLAVAATAEAVCRYVLHYGYPYRSPLPDDRFPDLTQLVPRFQHLHTLQFFTDAWDQPFMYPAPVAACYRAFFIFTPHESRVFVCFVSLCAVIAALLFCRNLVRHGLGRPASVFLVTFALLTSYPLWFEIRQANMEICCWLFAAVGLWAFLRERGYSAAACFGIAGAMKILPFAYLGLFLTRRHYRLIPVALLSVAAVTLPSLWLVYPHLGDSWHLTNLAVSKFRTTVTLGMFIPEFDHSAFALLKRFLFRHISAHHLGVLLTAYSATVVILMLVLFFGRIRKLPVINQVLCLCVATVLLPPTSFDYTLMALYLPWALLVVFAILQDKKGQASPGLVPAMVCFAILFVPETEIIYHHLAAGGQIKALTLVALLYIGLRYRFPLTTSSSGFDAKRALVCL